MVSGIQSVIVVCLLVTWVGVLVRRDSFAPPAVTHATIKFTHILPAVLQMVLFAYWACHWPEVIEHLPVIAIQLAVAYAIDVLLAWTLRRPYSPSLGPLPIVLSINLFVWFLPGEILLYALVVAIALSSKTFLLSAGRHIFNPSVFAIAVVGMLCILLPGWFQYRDISHDFSRPPHMAHLIVLLALIPQVRLRTAPVAVGAVLSMLGVMLLVDALTGYRGGPSPWWPPWLLTITLLAGDPATIPSGSVSRLLFGLFLGATFYLVSRGLLFTVGTDFFAKVIPIPLANLLVPSFERVTPRLSARWPGLRRVTGNGAYVAAWISMAILMLLANRWT
jgi:hypothetical protein